MYLHIEKVQRADLAILF